MSCSGVNITLALTQTFCKSNEDLVHNGVPVQYLRDKVPSTASKQFVLIKKETTSYFL